MKGTKTLVRNAKFTDQQLKNFILEVVNAADRLVDGSDDYLAQKCRRFFPTRDRDIQLMAEVFSRLRDPNHPDPNNPFFQKEAGEILCRGVIGDLRNSLRAVWLAEYDDVAEWRLFTLQALIHGRTDYEDRKSRWLHPPSLDTPIELALDWVRRNLLMLRVCRNPACLRPFFVARATQQRLCSDTCVAAAQRGHRNQWWRKNKGRLQDKQEATLRIPEQPATEQLPVSTTPIGSASVTEAPQLRVNVRPGAKIIRKKRTDASSVQSQHKLKRFLYDITNASENSADYLLKVYASAGFLPPKTKTERMAALNPGFLKPEELISTRRRDMRQAVEELREGLRSIWSADNDYTAQWRLFNLQSEISRSTGLENFSDDDLQPPPADRLVHQAFDCLRRNLRLLRTCENGACQTPFFVADKGAQKYCSDICARAGQQKAKAHWWKVEGPGWRQRRRLQQKKVRRLPRKMR
jgi:hypothetical protein